MTDHIERMAQIALTVCKVNMSNEERNAAKGFGDCHDAFDGNVALFGAFCSEYFAEPEFTESEIETLNQVSSRLDAMIKNGELQC